MINKWGSQSKTENELCSSLPTSGHLRRRKAKAARLKGEGRRDSTVGRGAKRLDRRERGEETSNAKEKECKCKKGETEFRGAKAARL